MIETSETTAKLDAALAKAQGEFAAALASSPNPAFKTKYADLSAVMEAIRPSLTKHGISVTQWPIHSTDNRVHMVTRIAHDGEWIRGHFSMPVMKQDAHGYGSIVTYLRRYCYNSCLGVVDADDDGNAASGRDNEGTQRPTYQSRTPEPSVPPAVESIADTYIRKFSEAETAEAFEEQVEKARAAWSRFDKAGKAKVLNSIEARRAYFISQSFPDAVIEAAE